MWDEIAAKLPVTYIATLLNLDDEDLYENIITGNIPGLRIDQNYCDQLLLIVSDSIFELTHFNEQ